MTVDHASSVASYRWCVATCRDNFHPRSISASCGLSGGRNSPNRALRYVCTSGASRMAWGYRALSTMLTMRVPRERGRSVACNACRVRTASSRPMQRLRQSCLCAAHLWRKSFRPGSPCRGPHHEARREEGTLRRRLNSWSGKRDLNPRPSPWQGDALPLSYSRSIIVGHMVGQRGGILLMRERSCQAI